MQNHEIQAHIFIKQRFFILFRGLFACGLSILFIIFVLINPGIKIMSSDNSLLPLLAMVILLYGILEFFDAFITRKSPEYLINIQMAVLDSVIGLYVLVEQFGDYTNLILLLSAYLVIKGLFRLIAALNVRFPRSPRILLGGLASVSLGILLWMKGVDLSAHMLTLILCFDLALRGWSLVVFALWLIESARAEQAQLN